MSARWLALALGGIFAWTQAAQAAGQAPQPVATPEDAAVAEEAELLQELALLEDMEFMENLEMLEALTPEQWTALEKEAK
ncbi:MAG: hypothetical protein AB1439_06985 [candidate division FCPU426 bacterium]